jgi:hypothetical protein
VTLTRKLQSLAVTALLLAFASAEAQQPKKNPLVGYLTVAPLSANVARVEAFRQRGEACGPFRRTTDEIRAGNQSQNREPDRINYSADSLSQSG